MRKRTLVSVFGLAVGLVALPALADEAEERKEKTEELANHLAALEDGATPEEEAALEEFMEENFDGEELDELDDFIAEIADEEMDDPDEQDGPDLAELEDEMDDVDEEDVFDETPEDFEDEQDDIDDDLEDIVEDLDEFNHDNNVFDDDIDTEEVAEVDDDGEFEADDLAREASESLNEDDSDEIAGHFESDEGDQPENNDEAQEAAFSVPAGGLQMKGFASGIGKFSDESGDRVVATRTSGGPDAVTVTITENADGGHDASVVISGLTQVYPSGAAETFGDISASGGAAGQDDFEGTTATVTGEGDAQTTKVASFRAEPDTSFGYLVWGQWGHSEESESAGRDQKMGQSHFVVGEVTADTADLSGLGTATYNGYMEGGFAAGGTTGIDNVGGDMSLTADFGTKSFQGTYALGGSDLGAVVTNGTIDSGSWTDPAGLSATLGGDSSMGAVSGNLEGAFFGPSAEEVGGNWDLKIVGAADSAEIGGIGTGAFAAKR